MEQQGNGQDVWPIRKMIQEYWGGLVICKKRGNRIHDEYVPTQTKEKKENDPSSFAPYVSTDQVNTNPKQKSTNDKLKQE